MLLNLEEHYQAAQSFYQTYFTDILMQIFSVVTDTSHTAGIAMHASILAHMFTLVESNRITVSLGPIPDNTLYVQEYVASLLKSAFSHLTDNQIKIFVTGLFNLNLEVPAFKEHLRDFLIQIRVSVLTSRSIHCDLKNLLCPCKNPKCDDTESYSLTDKCLIIGDNVNGGFLGFIAE